MQRDTILFVSLKVQVISRILRDLEPILGFKPKAVLITNRKVDSLKVTDKDIRLLVLKGRSSPSFAKQLTRAQLTNQSVLAITCHSESAVPLYEKLLAIFPYVLGPTESSLRWSTNKLAMRRLFEAYDKSLNPKFALIKSSDPKTLAQLAKKVGFPLVVKPTGLAASLLVSQSYYFDELQLVVKRSLRRLKSIYKSKQGRGTPSILVEQMIEGQMYTVDCYVNQKGKIYFCPLVYVRTGKQQGYDDFFGFKRITPVDLAKEHQDKVFKTAEKAVYALGLRNATCHIELLIHNRKCKIIEVGPRIGGYRNQMYRLSYGFNHYLNDILNKLGKKPVIYKRPKGYSCVINLYPPKEGIVKDYKGTKKASRLKSVYKFKSVLKKGQRVYFAKHGGDPVVQVILYNKSKSRLEGDLRRLDQLIKIKVGRKQ